MKKSKKQLDKIVACEQSENIANSSEALAAKVSNPQEGFFDPSSMAWRLNREMVLRALFLQVAHPKVA